MIRKFILLASLLLASCSKEEFKELFYEYNSNQPTTIVANVFIMEHSIVTFESMEREVNADYFHRYGIHIELNLMEERMSLSDGVKFENQFFLPKKQDTVTIYIVPQQYVNVPGAAAYALPGNNVTVVGDRRIRNRTLAHELGHIFGLDHTEIDNNVMTPLQGAKWRERPNNFEDWQVDEMLGRIDKLELSSKSSQMIID